MLDNPTAKLLFYTVAGLLFSGAGIMLFLSARQAWGTYTRGQQAREIGLVLLVGGVGVSNLSLAAGTLYPILEAVGVLLLFVALLGLTLWLVGRIWHRKQQTAAAANSAGR